MKNVVIKVANQVKVANAAANLVPKVVAKVAHALAANKAKAVTATSKLQFSTRLVSQIIY